MSIPEKFLLATEILVDRGTDVNDIDNLSFQLQSQSQSFSKSHSLSQTSPPPSYNSPTQPSQHPQSSSSSQSHPLLRISYLSAASIPLALPPLIALGFGLGLPLFDISVPWWVRYVLGWRGINERVRDWVWWMAGMGAGVGVGDGLSASSKNGDEDEKGESRSRYHDDPDEVDLEKGRRPPLQIPFRIQFT